MCACECACVHELKGEKLSGEETSVLYSAWERRGLRWPPPSIQPPQTLHCPSRLIRINMDFILIMSSATANVPQSWEMGAPALGWHADGTLFLGSGENGAEEVIVLLIAPSRGWFTVILMPWSPVHRHHKKGEK